MSPPVEMYAISLWQPWASFIAIGVKPFETRHWSAPVRLIGQRIAIHAATKAINRDDREWARRVGATDLPLGAVVCTALLAGAYQLGREIDGAKRVVRAVAGSLEHGSVDIDEFGDYEMGRWAWLLTGIERVAPPVPAKGHQGFWKWQPPSTGPP